MIKDIIIYLKCLNKLIETYMDDIRTAPHLSIR